MKRALPPAIEPLYEVARIAKRDDGQKRLRAAIRSNRLTPTVGIREIREIRTGRRRSKQPQKPAGSVTLTLTGCSEVRVVRLVAALLDEEATASIATDSQSVVDAVRAALVRAHEERAQSAREPVPHVPDVN